ncbi:hypothetical protein TNCT_566081 [Trichonephila clavata]|uniref:Uncharacterized protein n=1 Tax=Trichonephila clavata TaxID=2740835 RepID=A0A8X6I503_TRICU|nr:hypothetical protein TNCT_566081 [Trichonephila clavata]
MACAGLLENEIHGGGERGGKNNTFLSVLFPKAIRMPNERSQGPPCRMEACCLSKSLKYSWTVLNHCFVVWMDAFSAQRRYPAVHGQVEGIVLLSKETCTVGKPIPLCPGDLKHCIVILKRSSVVQ